MNTKQNFKKVTVAFLVSIGLIATGCGGGGGDAGDSYAVHDIINISMMEDTTIYINLETEAVITTGEEAQVGEDVLPYSIQTQPSHGLVTLNGSSLGYTPDEDWYGEDVVTLEQGTEEDLDYRLVTVNYSVKDAPEENVAPIISGTPTVAVSTDTNYSFVPLATDANGDTLTFAISGKPSWATFNSTTGELSGVTPSYDDVTSDIIITVTDGEEEASLPTFFITITDDNHAPTIEGVPATEVAVGQDYSFIPIANDADGDVLTFHISTIPYWATFDSTTGELSGTAQADEDKPLVFNDIVIYVTDGDEVAYLSSYTLEVVVP